MVYVLVFWPQGMWDLSSLVRDQTGTPCIGKQSLNQWTVREDPELRFLAKCLAITNIVRSLARHLLRFLPAF